MDWILDHLQLVIAVAASFAYWLSTRRQQQAERDGGEEERPQAHLHDEEAEARARAERARRVREEIQRKIAERQGRPVPLPSSQQPRPQAPAARSVVRPLAAPASRGPAQRSAASAPRPDLYAALREQQQRIEAERRRLDEARQRAAQISAGAGIRDSRGATRVPRRGQSSVQGELGSANAGLRPSLDAGDIRSALHDRGTLKRALVLREILGPPISQQRGR